MHLFYPFTSHFLFSFPYSSFFFCISAVFSSPSHIFSPKLHWLIFFPAPQGGRGIFRYIDPCWWIFYNFKWRLLGIVHKLTMSSWFPQYNVPYVACWIRNRYHFLDPDEIISFLKKISCTSLIIRFVSSDIPAAFHPDAGVEPILLHAGPGQRG